MADHKYICDDCSSNHNVQHRSVFDRYYCSKCYNDALEDELNQIEGELEDRGKEN